MKNNLLFIKIFIVYLLIIPIHVFGSTIRIDSSSDTYHVGDTVVLKVFLDTEKDLINSVDGEIIVNDPSNSFLVKEINIASSNLTLWPRTPSLSIDKKAIAFTGGTTVGIKGNNLNIFSIVMEAIKPGRVILNSKNTIVLMHDGKGTITIPKDDIKTINILEGDRNRFIVDEWSSVNSNDTTSPKKFIIDIGSDPSLFEGKKFISFNTTDGESGIDYYVVTEGSLQPVRSGSVYVLQNQDTLSIITVDAVDKAGNITTSTHDQSTQDYKNKILIVISVLFIVAIIWFFMQRKNYYHVE